VKRAHRRLIGAVASLLAGVAWAQSPDAWIKGRSDDGYEMGVDLPGPSETGPAAVYLKSLTPRPAGFSALRQSMSAEMYRAARVRMSASVKAEGVTGSAGLWMRVDGVKPSGAEMARLLAFDNMCNRPILGSSDWKTYEIVLDVPKDALQIVYGILLSPRGPGNKKSKESIGEVWIKNVHFDIVDRKVKTTGGRDYSCPEWSRQP
jgi:hypothetical protein